MSAWGPRPGSGVAAGILAAALACLFAAVALAGCGSGDGDELTVAAAASLRPAFGDGGEDGVRFTFGGSDLPANQVRQGAGIDVIAAASTIQPDALHEDGLVERPVEFAGNRLVVGVPEDSAIDSLEDLARPDTSVVVGDGSVPVGIYAREMISKLPRQTAAAIGANVRSQEQDATSITAKLTQGAADAGIVYATDVHQRIRQTEGGGHPRPAPAAHRLLGRRRFFERDEGRGAGVHREPRLRRTLGGAEKGRAAAPAVSLRPSRHRLFGVAAFFAALLAFAFLLLPLVALFTSTDPATFVDSLGEPANREALWLSLKATAMAMLILLVIGTPAAYFLAMRSFRGRSAVLTLRSSCRWSCRRPSPVSRVLAAFGPAGLLGPTLEDLNVELVFQTAGVVVALVFVASPSTCARRSPLSRRSTAA